MSIKYSQAVCAGAKGQNASNSIEKQKQQPRQDFTSLKTSTYFSISALHLFGRHEDIFRKDNYGKTCSCCVKHHCNILPREIWIAEGGAPRCTFVDLFCGTRKNLHRNITPHSTVPGSLRIGCNYKN